MAELEELRKRCEELNLNPTPTRNRVNKETKERYLETSIDDCEKAIQEYYLNIYEKEGTKSPFIDNILKLKEPMLATQIKNLKPHLQEQVRKDNSNYLYEEKLDGSRCLLCYDYRYGFDMYSRGTSVTDRLPISYKTKILLPDISKEIIEVHGVSSFIIDTEIIPMSKDIQYMTEDGIPLVADTQLGIVNAVLNSLDTLAHKMQKANPLKFMAFDIIMLNDTWLTDKPLIERKGYLNKIINLLKLAGMDVRIESVKSTIDNKDRFYNDILYNNGEGVVAKDLYSMYDTSGKRAGQWVKLKRSVSQTLLEEQFGDTIDAFVIGFEEGTRRNTE